jgi:hypothetical protein
MTDDQKALAIELRRAGLPYVQIAAKIGCGESGTYIYLRSVLNPPVPKLKPEPKHEQPKPNIPPAGILPHKLNTYCPMRRRIDPAKRDGHQLTKSEMRTMLEAAVRNTI